MVIVIIFIIILFLVLFVRFMNFKLIVKAFDNNNILVGGLRGTGKDMLFSNYVAYNKLSKYYVSIIDYKIKKKTFIPLDFKALDIKNNFSNLINCNVNKYIYPYPEKAPILLPDAQLYFPSAYQELLKRDYKGIVNFFPLSRHLANNQIHCNSQNASMIWDKLRVQSDLYILCKSCKVLFKKMVFMRVYLYEKYDSFVNHIPPYKKPVKLFGNKKVDIDLHKISYMASYGEIKVRKLFFINRSNYNTRYFKQFFEGSLSSQESTNLGGSRASKEVKDE